MGRVPAGMSKAGMGGGGAGGGGRKGAGGMSKVLSRQRPSVAFCSCLRGLVPICRGFHLGFECQAACRAWHGPLCCTLRNGLAWFASLRHCLVAKLMWWSWGWQAQQKGMAKANAVCDARLSVIFADSRISGPWEENCSIKCTDLYISRLLWISQEKHMCFNDSASLG